MKATLFGLGALLVAACCCPSSQADPYYPYYYYPRVAPDACGPGTYCVNGCGQAYGPNYNVRPCFQPYNGERPCLPGKGRPAAFGPDQQQPAGPLGFPTHPYARSPRDFFMMD